MPRLVITWQRVTCFWLMARHLLAVAARLGELSRSVDWVMLHQQSDGCFHSVGELLHYELRVRAGTQELRDSG